MRRIMSDGTLRNCNNGHTTHIIHRTTQLDTEADAGNGKKSPLPRTINLQSIGSPSRRPESIFICCSSLLRPVGSGGSPCDNSTTKHLPGGRAFSNLVGYLNKRPISSFLNSLRIFLST